MNKKKTIIKKAANLIGCIALTIAYYAANGQCTFIYHEIEMPEEVKRLKKR